MTELTLILLGGLLGSTHCLGMCGPLALAVGVPSPGAARNLVRQLAFSGGRIFTYGFLGALAGFCGWWLSNQPTVMVNLQALLAVVAGVFLIVLGLLAAGVLPSWQFLSIMPHLCGSSGWIKTFLSEPGLRYCLLAGVFTGFLPCGLVYAFLAFAATTGDMLQGGLTMVAFGLGTVPLMVVAGLGGSVLGRTAQTRVLRLAAWCVVLTGIISFARGTGFLQLTAQAAPSGCPLCP